MGLLFRAAKACCLATHTLYGVGSSRAVAMKISAANWQAPQSYFGLFSVPPSLDCESAFWVVDGQGRPKAAASLARVSSEGRTVPCACSMCRMVEADKLMRRPSSDRDQPASKRRRRSSAP